jgi:serine protease
VTALLVFGLSPASQAKTQDSEEKISSIIVSYSLGVSSVAPDGEPTGANLIPGVSDSSHLGGDLYALNLDQEVTISEAKRWVYRMVLDRRISSADLDYAIVPLALTPKEFRITPFAKARPASAPTSVSAKVAIDKAFPSQPRIRLSWDAPARRYGAAIVGYRILLSTNGSAFRVLIRNTETRSRNIFISDGLEAGANLRFRVRAITNDGSGNVVGAASSNASALVRTTPKPVFQNSATLVGPGNMRFLAQSKSDRGGFSLTKTKYRGVAVATGIESVDSTSCNESRCRFPNLQDGVEYNIEIFASNPRGTTSSKDFITPTDTYFAYQWHLTGQYGMGLPSAWNYSRGSSDKIVAVIDTGIKLHPDVESRLTKNSDGSVYGYDFVSDLNSAADGDAEDSDPTDMGGDANGQNSYHGTHVAGIIAASHNDDGIAGVSPGVRVLPIRALGREGGSVQDLIRAINWATGVSIDGIPKNRYPVSVINLSLGAKEAIPCSTDYAKPFEAAFAKGISVVVAAGNDSRNSLSFPANCPNVISVVATQSMGDKASYSNSGAGSVIAAPGGEFSVGSAEAPQAQGAILSLWVDPSEQPQYRLSEGTSMAAPLVAGVVALMYSQRPRITPTQVLQILTKSARPFAPGSSCEVTGECGAGILNAHLALARTSLLR